MASRPPRPERQRPRHGSLERPINARMYRGTWLLVGIPLLIAAFSVSRPATLDPPALPPTFDRGAALTLATDLARRYPDRSPGSAGALGAARWFSDRLKPYGFATETQTFEATIPGRGHVPLRNLIAKAAGRSSDVIVVMAHRDDTGVGQGANDNASGTAALVELARGYAQAPATDPAGGSVRPSHTIVFLSTDGGAFGELGAAHFASDPAYRDHIVAVVNLDSLASGSPPRLRLSGDRPRSPAASLVQTAAARIVEQTGSEPDRPSALEQLIDLGFPFSFFGQAPFVAEGVPAVTLGTGGDRPPPPFTDATERLNAVRLDQLGRSAQALLGSLDQGLEVTSGAPSYVYVGRRIVPGWAVELVLIAALFPVLACTVDLFARLRRRRIPLAPALRSFRSRLALWLFIGLVFWLLGVAGAWPEGAPRPLDPQGVPATTWPALGLGVLAGVAAVAWLVTRERLLPRRAVTDAEELAGYTASLLALSVLSLVVIATNAFALVFLLPSLHAWLWLPQIRRRRAGVRAAVYAVGLAGPLALLSEFAWRFGLGFDAPWYLLTLVAVGYVDVAAILTFLAWAAAAAQLAALSARRYAPYPSAAERPPRGPLREIVRRTVLAVRSRRGRRSAETDAAEA
jgi:Peptidase family M28